MANGEKIRDVVMWGGNLNYMIIPDLRIGIGTHARTLGHIEENKQKMYRKAQTHIIFSLTSRYYFWNVGRLGMYADARAGVNSNLDNKDLTDISYRLSPGLAWKIGQYGRIIHLGYTMHFFKFYAYSYATDNQGDTVYRDTSGLKRANAHSISVNFTF